MTETCHPRRFVARDIGLLLAGESHVSLQVSGWLSARPAPGLMPEHPAVGTPGPGEGCGRETKGPARTRTASAGRHRPWGENRADAGLMPHQLERCLARTRAALALARTRAALAVARAPHARAARHPAPDDAPDDAMGRRGAMVA